MVHKDYVFLLKKAVTEETKVWADFGSGEGSFALALRDLRGPQRRIGRLSRFSFEGYLHVLVYRFQIPLTILYALLIAAYLVVGGLGLALKIVTAVVWVLWTPQLFEVAKGLALAWSRGMVFGRLNEEFAHLYRKRYGGRSALKALPYVFLVVWAAAFIALVARWQP